MSCIGLFDVICTHTDLSYVYHSVSTYHTKCGVSIYFISPGPAVLFIKPLVVRHCTHAHTCSHAQIYSYLHVLLLIIIINIKCT